MTQVRFFPGERNTSADTARTRAVPNMSDAKPKAGSESAASETPARWLRTHGVWLTCFLIYTVLGTGF